MRCSSVRSKSMRGAPGGRAVVLRTNARRPKEGSGEGLAGSRRERRDCPCRCDPRLADVKAACLGMPNTATFPTPLIEMGCFLGQREGGRDADKAAEIERRRELRAGIP